VALQDELISFAASYKDLKKGLLENVNDNETDSESLESEEEYTEVAESQARNQENFSPPLEKCFGHNSKLLDTVQKVWPPRKLVALPSVPSWLQAC